MKVNVYKFKELSPEIQKRVLDSMGNDLVHVLAEVPITKIHFDKMPGVTYDVCINQHVHDVCLLHFNISLDVIKTYFAKTPNIVKMINEKRIVINCLEKDVPMVVTPLMVDWDIDPHINAVDRQIIYDSLNNCWAYIYDQEVKKARSLIRMLKNQEPEDYFFENGLICPYEVEDETI